MSLSESVKRVICDRWSFRAEATVEPTEQVDAVMEMLRFETWLQLNQQQLLDALSFA